MVQLFWGSLYFDMFDKLLRMSPETVWASEMPVSFLKGSEWELSPVNTMRHPEKVFGSLQLLFDELLDV